MDWKTPENRFTVGFLTAVFVGFVVVILAAKGDMHPVWCWMHRWQTLIAGVGAIAAAVFAARIAWRAAMKQIKITADIPFEMRRNELVWERLKLEQICRRIGMYKDAASEYMNLCERWGALESYDFRGQFMMTEPISRPTASKLGSMAETCQMPGLRAELLNAQRNVKNFNTAAKKLENLCRSTRSWERKTSDKVDAARTDVDSNARAVVASINAIIDAVAHDLRLIEIEDARLAERRIGD